MNEYLKKIERALNNPLYSYSHNNVIVSCEHILKHKKLKKEQYRVIENFIIRLKDVEYINIYTGKINPKVSYREFAHVVNELYDYIKTQLS